MQDGQGKDLNFIQESKDEDAGLGIIAPENLEVGKDYTLTIQYSGGDALRDSGGGNFPDSGSSWYPNNSGTHPATGPSLTSPFVIPGLMFVGTGVRSSLTADGNLMVAKWSSGKTELAVAGFN